MHAGEGEDGWSRAKEGRRLDGRRGECGKVGGEGLGRGVGEGVWASGKVGGHGLWARGGQGDIG